MSPGHCEFVNSVNILAFCNSLKELVWTGFKPVSGVSVWMLVWMPFSYRSCRSRRATVLLGSPCKGPRVLYPLWLGLCECFVRVNVLVSVSHRSNQLPCFFTFRSSQFQSLLLALPGVCELLAFCLISVSGPFAGAVLTLAKCQYFLYNVSPGYVICNQFCTKHVILLF